MRQAVGGTDSGRRLPDREGVGVADLDQGQVCGNEYDRHVGLGVGADEFCDVTLAVGAGHDDAVRAIDHVSVGQHVGAAVGRPEGHARAVASPGDTGVTLGYGGVTGFDIPGDVDVDDGGNCGGGRSHHGLVGLSG